MFCTIIITGQIERVTEKIWGASAIYARISSGTAPTHLVINHTHQYKPHPPPLPNVEQNNYYNYYNIIILWHYDKWMNIWLHELNEMDENNS